MKIEFTSSPDQQDIDFITKKILQENPHYGEDSSPFAFYVRSNDGKIIAGVNGYIVYGEIYVDQLWVHPLFRNMGVGRQLMEEVHEFGRYEGCKVATVQTMCFQKALSFYEHLDYVKEFERIGQVKNSTCYFLIKELHTEK